MENTTKTGTFHLPKIKLLRGAAAALFAFVICRGPILGDCFPIAISFIAYMTSRNPINAWMLMPAAAGILTYLPRGYDPWGDLTAMGLCCLLFLAARRICLALWQKGLIAASASVVCVSIYRLATSTVYKTSVEMLLLEGLLVFVLVLVFAAFCNALERRSSGREWSLASFAIICVMTINGAGMAFLMWHVILFLGLWALQALDVGTALFMTAAAGLTAALLEQEQWGLMATLMVGLTTAALVKKYGTFAMTAVFAAVCWILGFVKSGVVLGVDVSSLLPTSAAFLAVSWKFGDAMAQLLYLFAGAQAAGEPERNRRTDSLLKERIGEMEALAELYATYLDSRAILANQFSITGQIIDDIRWQIGRQGGKTAGRIHEKFHADVAVSQCAASGVISGDCCGWQEIGDGKLVMVISDGMGKGKKAAAESLMVTRTILSLLKTGVTAELALKMINTIMLMKEEEDFYATVDLAVIDRKTGKAKFYKIGAAPTLIRRKNNVEEVQLSAVPLGIVNGLKIRYVETALKKDDWIIMMSDGVSDGGESRGGSGKGFLCQIKEAAADVRTPDPQVMSDLILNRAADSYIGKERDDLTVMVARIT